MLLQGLNTLSSVASTIFAKATCYDLYSSCSYPIKTWHVNKIWDSERLAHTICKGHFTHETKSPSPLHFKHSHQWKKRSGFKFDSHYAWGTNGECECKMDVKSIWIPTWHRMDHVSWSRGLISQTTHLLEVGLTQNREIMALWTLIAVDLFYFIMCEDPHE